MHKIKEEMLITSLLVTATVRVVVIKIYFLFRKPPLCFGRRGVVFSLFSFSLSKNCFLKKYAEPSRIIPFAISFKSSTMNSMIITSLPSQNGKKLITNHPHNIQLSLFYHTFIFLPMKNSLCKSNTI